MNIDKYNESQHAKSAQMQYEARYGQPEPLTAAVAILVASALIGGAISVLYFAANS